MALATRQPFAEIGSPRLQALSSAKNRQNAISPNFSGSQKSTPSQSTGKRRATDVFEDEYDGENIDPSVFNSPTKKSKTSDGFSKPSNFSLVSSPLKPSSSLTSSPSVSSVRKTLSSPSTSKSTPISLSRGSPKHKRVGLLSKRRVSSSPYRRVDPPSSNSSPALPFSIDAALSGTVSNYSPAPAKSPDVTPAATPAPAPVTSPVHEETMPKSWFFEIYEDTPEQEAANLMEHSAAILDISSDDDIESKRRNELLERGKENIPPPDFQPAQPRGQQDRQGIDGQNDADPKEHTVKLPRLRKVAQDAMDEDRKPLGDLCPKDFYAEGLDATSYVTVDVGLEKPSGLSREFDFGLEQGKEQEEFRAEEQGVEIYSDETATAANADASYEDGAASCVEVAATSAETEVQVPEVQDAAVTAALVTEAS